MSKIFLDPDGIKKLYGAARSRCIRDEALVRIMGNTGLRVTDARTLLVSDVSNSVGEVYSVIRRKMKKTGAYVERSLNDETREVIRKYLPQVVGGKYLFPGPSGDVPMGRTTCHYLFKSLLESVMPAGTDTRAASTHTLRRSVGFAISEKCGIETAAEFLGHKSLSSTMSYLSKEKLKRKADDFLSEEMNF